MFCKACGNDSANAHEILSTAYSQGKAHGSWLMASCCMNKGIGCTLSDSTKVRMESDYQGFDDCMKF